MLVRLHVTNEFISADDPIVYEYKCKWVKVIGKRIEICVSDHCKVRWTTDSCTVEVVNER